MRSSLLSQILLNGVVAASLYVLVGTSFWLIYSATRFFCFTHGISLALGAYAVVVATTQGALGNTLGLIGAPFVAAVFSAVAYLAIYRPLLRREAGTLALFLASLGIYIVAQNVLSASFGDAALSARRSFWQTVIPIGGGRLLVSQGAQVLVALGVWAGLGHLLTHTHLGLHLRAIRSSRELANITGIPGEHVAATVFALAGAIAGLAGGLQALHVDATPTMGLSPLLMGIVAMIIGGGSLAGTVGGACLLGLSQNIAIVWIGSQWQATLTYVILLIYLACRAILVAKNRDPIYRVL